MIKYVKASEEILEFISEDYNTDELGRVILTRLEISKIRSIIIGLSKRKTDYPKLVLDKRRDFLYSTYTTLLNATANNDNQYFIFTE